MSKQGTKPKGCSTPITVAIIGGAFAVLAAIIGALFNIGVIGLPSVLPVYTGQVIDANSQKPILGAKITLEGNIESLKPAYTNENGEFRVQHPILADKFIGHIKVEAAGYDEYDEPIEMPAGNNNVDVVRLNPQASASPFGTILLLVIGIILFIIVVIALLKRRSSKRDMEDIV